MQLGHLGHRFLESRTPVVDQSPSAFFQVLFQKPSNEQRLTVMSLQLSHQLVVAIEGRVVCFERFGFVNQEQGIRGGDLRPGSQHVAERTEMSEQESTKQDVWCFYRKRRPGDVVDLEFQAGTKRAPRFRNVSFGSVESN